jgi:hypothetical protein
LGCRPRYAERVGFVGYPITEAQPVTLLRFSGGEAVEVSLSLAEVQDLIQKAMAERVLLELHSPDGRVLVVNPHQVQYLQNAADVEADADGAATDGAPVAA